MRSNGSVANSTRTGCSPTAQLQRCSPASTGSPSLRAAGWSLRCSTRGPTAGSRSPTVTGEIAGSEDRVPCRVSGGYAGGVEHTAWDAPALSDPAVEKCRFHRIRPGDASFDGREESHEYERSDASGRRLRLPRHLVPRRLRG